MSAQLAIFFLVFTVTTIIFKAISPVTASQVVVDAYHLRDRSDLDDLDDVDKSGVFFQRNKRSITMIPGSSLSSWKDTEQRRNQRIIHRRTTSFGQHPYYDSLKSVPSFLAPSSLVPGFASYSSSSSSLGSGFGSNMYGNNMYGGNIMSSHRNQQDVLGTSSTAFGTSLNRFGVGSSTIMMNHNNRNSRLWTDHTGSLMMMLKKKQGRDRKITKQTG